MNTTENYSQRVKNIVNYMNGTTRQKKNMKGMSCVSRSFDIAQNSSEVIKSWNSATTGIQAVNSLGGASEFKALTQSALDSIKSAQLGMKALNDWGGVSGILAAAKRANESRRYLAAATAGIQAMNSLGGASEIPVLTQSALGSIKSAQLGMKALNDWGGVSGILATAKRANESRRYLAAATAGIQAVNSLGGASEFKALTQSALDSIKSAQLGMKALNDCGGLSGILAAEQAMERLKSLNSMLKPFKSICTGEEREKNYSIAKEIFFKEKAVTPAMNLLYSSKNVTNSSMAEEYYCIVSNIQEGFDVHQEYLDSIWKDFEQNKEKLESDNGIYPDSFCEGLTRKTKKFFRKSFNIQYICSSIMLLYTFLEKKGVFGAYTNEVFAVVAFLNFVVYTWLCIKENNEQNSY